MKQEYKQKLLKVSKIIGDGESPDIFYNRREFLKRSKLTDPSVFDNGNSKLGHCDPCTKIIYINPSTKLPDDTKKRLFSLS